MDAPLIEDHAPEKHINSFRYAWNGLSHAFLTQRNFRLQIILGFTIVVMAYVLGFDRLEWIVMLLTIGLVLTAELANTILETLVDLSVQRVHPKARVAKDLSAGAVLIISIFSLIIGLILVVPHLLLIFHLKF